MLMPIIQKYRIDDYRVEDIEAPICVSEEELKVLLDDLVYDDSTTRLNGTCYSTPHHDLADEAYIIAESNRSKFGVGVCVWSKNNILNSDSPQVADPIPIEEDEVLNFINPFKRFEKDKVLHTTFTEGYCYYFALMLQHRFPEGELYYLGWGHFVTKIGDKFYDITGNCTETCTKPHTSRTILDITYIPQSWKEIQATDPDWAARIIEGCITK